MEYPEAPVKRRSTRADEWYHACRGGNLPPATFRIQPVWLNGTTQCSGDDSSPCNAANTPGRRMNGIALRRARRGGNLPPATFRIQPVRLNGTTHRHVIPRERMRVEGSSQVASFPIRRILLLLGKIPPLRYAPVGMTDVSGLLVTNLNVPQFRLTPDGGRLPPLHCVVPFNPTG